MQDKAKKKAELLAAHADSIQRQRYARKRLALKTPEGSEEAELSEKELKIEYDTIMRAIMELNLDRNIYRSFIFK